MRYKPRNKKTGMFPYESTIYETRPKKRGVKYGYETSELTYTITRTYIPDFTVTFPDGRILYIEVKGWLRPEDRVKMRSVKEHNPTLDIRFIFPKESKRNSMWCKRYGFPYAIGAIPAEWIDDKEALDHEEDV